MNVSQLIASTIIKFMDQIKAKPSIWLAIGILFITMEQVLLTGLLPFQIPTIVSEVVFAVALSLTNATTTFYLSPKKIDLSVLQTLPDGKTFGGTIDQLIAALVEKLKAGNMTVYSVLVVIFGGLKFYLLHGQVPATVPEFVVNGLLSLALLFVVPRTKPILQAHGIIPPLSVAKAA